MADQPELILKYHQLVDEKSDLETTSKQTLKRMMNEKMDIQNKYEDLKRSLNKSEEESEIYREQLTRVEKMSQKLLEGKFQPLKAVPNRLTSVFWQKETHLTMPWECEFLMLFSEEKKLRVDLTKRITEANLDKERLAQMENLLLQGKVTEAFIIWSWNFGYQWNREAKV